MNRFYPEHAPSHGEKYLLTDRENCDVCPESHTTQAYKKVKAVRDKESREQ